MAPARSQWAWVCQVGLWFLGCMSQSNTVELFIYKPWLHVGGVSSVGGMKTLGVFVIRMR